MIVPAGVGAAETKRYGFVEFPRDEHQHVDGWNYWWGAAELVTRKGNRYYFSFAFDSFYGVGASGHQLYARQGPYRGKTLMTIDGPEEWGHAPGTATRVVYENSNYSKRTPLPYQKAFNLEDGGREIANFRRTSAEKEAYRITLDQDTARLHPSGESLEWDLDLWANMKSPPLLLGGTGQWWYGIPQTFQYPSRSYQYMQAAKKLRGGFTVEQPDGSILRERIRPDRSSMVLVREYDATPEDLFFGLALKESTQLHERYVQTYHGGMPWDLFFVDLTNDVQLMIAVLSFHSTDQGSVKLTPLFGAEQPTYQILATIRLPNGKSIPLDDTLRVEHLGYRHKFGLVPTFAVQTKGLWTQAWKYRVSHPAIKFTEGRRKFRVPAFDLGIVPGIGKGEPRLDEKGNGLHQRLPYKVRGSYGGCPVKGFGWGEAIVNWYGYEQNDPWYTERKLPRVPKRCGKPRGGKPGSPGDLGPQFETRPLDIGLKTGCIALNPGPQGRCEFVADEDLGLGGMGPAAGAWKVTIHRPGEPGPREVKALTGGPELYVCGTVRPGDRVVAEARVPFSGIMVGDPGICF